MLLFRSF